jgi:uncharacterized protein DUF3311
MTISAKAGARRAWSLAIRNKQPLDWRWEFRYRGPTHHVSGGDDGTFADPGGTMKFFLLLVPCLLALWVPLYNSIPPVLFGVPFFFWFQLVLVPISALAILAADRVGKN